MGRIYRIHGAAKLDQHAIAHHFDEAAAIVSLHDGLQNGLAALEQQPGQRIRPSSASMRLLIADDIGHHDGGQSANGLSCGRWHGWLPRQSPCHTVFSGNIEPQASIIPHSDRRAYTGGPEAH